MKYVIIFIPALFLCGSCSSLSGDMHLTDKQRLAVCASQQYLNENGYLDSDDGIDSSKIDLELLDAIKYTKNGAIDWAALLRDRRGHFSNKLYGIKNDGADFLVVYREVQGYSCVIVSSNLNEIHLNEANCKPGSSIARIREDLVKCN